MDLISKRACNPDFVKSAAINHTRHRLLIVPLQRARLPSSVVLTPARWWIITGKTGRQTLSSVNE